MKALEEVIAADPRFATAWFHALGYARQESAFRMLRLFGHARVKPPAGFRDHVRGEFRQGRLFQAAVTAQRRTLVRHPGYECVEETLKQMLSLYLRMLFKYAERRSSDVPLQYFAVSWALETRLSLHFEELVRAGARGFESMYRESARPEAETETEAERLIGDYERRLFDRMSGNVLRLAYEFTLDERNEPVASSSEDYSLRCV